MDKNKIDRINALAKKAKTEGLTPEESTERQKLREEYINAFRSNLQSTLDNIVVVDKSGNQTKLKKKDGRN